MDNQGALPSQILRHFASSGVITSTQKLTDTTIQPSSFDLSLGDEAYEVEGSILPVIGRTPLSALLADPTFVKQKMNVGDGLKLERKKIYIIKLQQSLQLPHGICGIANPKSSAGRIDLQVRLLAHESGEFDVVPSGFTGELYVEVSAKSMDIVVHQGDGVNQLRLFNNIEMLNDKEIAYMYDKHLLLLDSKDRAIRRDQYTIHERGLRMTVNLEGDGVVGYILKQDAPVLDISLIRHYAVEDFWEPIYAPKNGRLKLEQDRFYILRTREKIRVPMELCCEMLPYDARVGNFRSHYAGFFDPGFGYGANGEVQGAHAVLEVRPHDENIVLTHGQPICKMVFWRNAEIPDVAYDVQVKSNYQGQSLKLAKFFK